MTEGMKRLSPWKDMLTKIKHIVHAMVYGAKHQYT
jgi:hypothetical protein